ncbi:unnamed protein product [Clonostachys byssicola]|uniref:Uncharacterized protein n=1 Tax=Clonostachys byssicola TaxID=160290 RepID=A0A9N9UTD0_9HYPO|nr:unnamed protein product [Clonostachys byssicola]
MRSINGTWLAALALSWTGTVQAQSECSTITKTSYAVATTVTDISSFRSSLNSRFSTPGVSWSGARVPYYSTVLTGGNGVPYTGIYYYDSHALSSAGYEVISAPHTTISCPPTTTPTLPPSPTGSGIVIPLPLRPGLKFPQKRAAPMGITGIVHLVSLNRPHLHLPLQLHLQLRRSVSPTGTIGIVLLVSPNPQHLHRPLSAPHQPSARRQLSVRASLMEIIGTVHLEFLNLRHHHHQVLLPLPLWGSVKPTMITGTALQVSLNQLHPHQLPPAPRQSSMSVSHMETIGIALQVFLSPQRHHHQVLPPLLSRMSVRLMVIIGIAHQAFLNQRHRQIPSQIPLLYYPSQHQVVHARFMETIGTVPPAYQNPQRNQTPSNQSTLKRTSLSATQEIGPPATKTAISSVSPTVVPVSDSSKVDIYRQWVVVAFIPAIFLLA